MLLGKDVQQAKLTESNGRNERVNLSQKAYERVANDLRFEDGNPGYFLVIDDLSDDKLGEYEITPVGRRMASTVLLTRDKNEVMVNIMEMLDTIEPMASYIPAPVLSLLVESAADRKIPPDFPQPTIMFVNFIGLPELQTAPCPAKRQNLPLIFRAPFLSSMQP